MRVDFSSGKQAADYSFATEGSTSKRGLQPLVANKGLVVATLGNNMSWGDYWKDVCAPKLKARKEELGRKVPEIEIAAYVESNSGKRTTRSALNLFLLGVREPYISQFYALCEKLELDPVSVLTEGKKEVPERTSLRRTGHENIVKTKGNRRKLMK